MSVKEQIKHAIDALPDDFTLKDSRSDRSSVSHYYRIELQRIVIGAVLHGARLLRNAIGDRPV